MDCGGCAATTRTAAYSISRTFPCVFAVAARCCHTFIVCPFATEIVVVAGGINTTICLGQAITQAFLAAAVPRTTGAPTEGCGGATT